MIPGEPADEDELQASASTPPSATAATGSRAGPTSSSISCRSASACWCAKATTPRSSAMGERCPCACRPRTILHASQGSSFDVLDLRSIFPYDWKTISAQRAKTGRLLIVNEDTEVTNFGEHLLRRVIDEHFYDLLVRPRLLAGKHVPGIGLNQVYEQNTVPQLPAIRSALEAVLTEAA